MVFAILQPLSTVSLDNAPGLLIDIIIALVIVLMGFMAGKIVGSILNKLLSEMQVDKGISRFKGQKTSVVRGISSTASIVIYVVSVIIALNHLNILWTAALVVLGLVAFIVVGSLLISFFSLFPKIYSGIQLAMNSGLKKGQKIDSKLVSGNVVEFSLFNVKIKTPEGDVLFVPNNTVQSLLKMKK